MSLQVRPLQWDTSNQGLLEGTMTRKQLMWGGAAACDQLRRSLLKKLDPEGKNPDREIVGSPFGDSSGSSA